MTAFQQNFTTYPGDTSQPIFTVVDQNSVPINISTVSEIRWDARKSLAAASAITKLKSAGGIVLIGGGVTGQLQVQLSGADTAPLSGVYLHQVVLTDGFGNQTTVSFGQLVVGRAPVWTYDATQLATSMLMQVRRTIGDVNYNDKQVFDDEINFAIAQRPGSLYGASAETCRMIAANYSRQVDIGEGSQRQAYSQKARGYLAMARLFESRARIAGPGVPYAGGISVADKQVQEQNSDRVGPNFTIGMTDNQLIPGDVGPETPGANTSFGDREWPDW